jgi:hypothetical protein
MERDNDQGNGFIQLGSMQRIDANGLSNTFPKIQEDTYDKEQALKTDEWNDPEYDFWADPFDEYTDVTNRSASLFTNEEISYLLRHRQVLIGIDKLAFGMYPWSIRPEAEYEWDTKKVLNNHRPGYEYTRTFISVTGHKVFVYLKTNADDSPPFMKVSFNPSEGSHLVSVTDSLEIARAIVEETETLVVHAADINDSTIQMVHITADFAPVADLQGALRAVEVARAKKGWQPNVHRSIGYRGGVSVTHKTKTAGEVMAYNKSAQAGLPEPTLRIEAKVFKKARSKYGLNQLRDLTKERAQDTFLDLIEPFTTALETQPKLSVFSEIRPSAIAEAVGAMWCTENQIHLSFPRSAKARHRNVCRTIGINRTDDLLN